MRARRYQLTKAASAIVDKDHPWIFRDQLSSAAGIFRDGDWLRLVDGANRVVAHGMFEAEGAIAIRILRRGEARPDAAWFRERFAAALAKRAALAAATDGIRLLNGESDGIPAVVIDRFGDDVVVSSYSAGADAIARYLARLVIVESSRTVTADSAESSAVASDSAALRVADVQADAWRAIGPARSITLRPAKRRHATAEPPRAFLGTPPDVARFVEDGIEYAVDLAAGHKTGTYLDLRGLRRDLAAAPLADARVLNLFAYTGMLGRAAEAAGAAAIVHVDASERALSLAAEYHVVDRDRHTFTVADVFEWLPALSEAEQFDLIVVDPPAMTSTKAQVPAVLAGYRKLYRAAAAHVRPGGAIVAACCTSRVERAQFHHAVSEALGHRFKKERELRPEVDHPVGFPQADYLKIAWWRRTA